MVSNGASTCMKKVPKVGGLITFSSIPIFLSCLDEKLTVFLNLSLFISSLSQEKKVDVMV